jgi:outer membrane protein assembly factor BamB
MTDAGRHVADLLPAFVNGTVTRSERERVMGHLPLCPACTTGLQAWQSIREATRLAATEAVPPLPEDGLNRLWAALDDLEPTIASAGSGIRGQRPRGLGSQPPHSRPTEDHMITQALPLSPSITGPIRLPLARPRSVPRLWVMLPLAAAMVLLLIGGVAYFGTSRDVTRLGALLQIQGATPPDVPMFRGNPARTGVLPGPGPAAKPEVLWQVNLGASAPASPPLINGVLYAGSADGVFRALDAATGDERWRFDTGGNDAPHPTVAEGLVFVGDNNPGEDANEGHGTLFVLDADDGSEVWRLPDAQTSGPLVIDGTLYLGIKEGYLAALDAANGTERWRAATGQISRSAAMADGTIYTGGKDGNVYAVDAATGEERWRYRTEGGTLGTPAVVDGTVYEIAFDGPADRLYALDAATGEERWRFAVGARMQPPAVANGMVYLPTGDGGVYALDAVTGTARWRFPIDSESVYPQILAGQTLFVSGAIPTLYAVDAATGKEQWHVDVAGPIGAPPIVSGGMIFLGTQTGQLYALGVPGEEQPLTVAAPADVGHGDGPVEFLWQAMNGSEKIDQPHGMALAPDGNLWIAEGGKSRILIFSPDGAFIEAWGTAGPGEGEFDFDLGTADGGYGGVAFDRDGNIFVADSGNYRIQKFDRNRNFLTAWGSQGTGDGTFQMPVTVAADSQGNVYVSDGGGIQKFSGNGEYLGRIGSWGNDDSQYLCTAILGIDARDNIYVPDCTNNRVMKFAPDGSLLMTFGAMGQDPGQFSNQAGVVVDDAGRIYVADTENHRVQVFDQEGRYLAAWGSFGTDRGQFNTPLALALDGQGNIYVNEFTNGRIQKFRLLPQLGADGATPAAS